MSEDETEKTVPYSRFEKKVTEMASMKEALADMQGQIDTYRTGAEGAEDLQGKLDALTAHTAAERETYSTTLALYKAGITDNDTADLVRWRFAKSAKSADEFEGWLSDEAKQDKLLAQHFATPEVAPVVTPEAALAPVPEAAPVTMTPPPDVNHGAKPAPPPRNSYTVESVQNMSTDQLKENYAGIMDAWGFGGKR